MRNGWSGMVLSPNKHRLLPAVFNIEASLIRDLEGMNNKIKVIK